MAQENIDSSFYYIFHINPATEWFIHGNNQRIFP